MKNNLIKATSLYLKAVHTYHKHQKKLRRLHRLSVQWQMQPLAQPMKQWKDWSI